MSTIAVAGRFARDAETRFSADGKQITSFSMAENVYIGGKKESQFFNCTLFGERGEKLAQHIKKGGAATVFGTLQIRKYTGKDGIERQSVDIIVGDVVLQGSASDNQATTQPTPPRKQESRQAKPQDDVDDDVPF